MSKAASRVRYVSTVLHPGSRPNQLPRQYFYLGRAISTQEAKLLEVRLTAECKHISNVIPCSATPKGELANFYVSWAVDTTPNCFNTQRRFQKYSNDVLRIITDLTAALVAT